MKKLNSKGYSLVEMMMVLLISTIAGYILFTTTRVANDQNETREARMFLQENIRDGFYKMVQEIRQTAPSRVTIYTSNGATTTSGPTIQFQVPNPSYFTTGTSYDLDWNNAHTIRYALGGTNNTQIIRTNVTSNTTTIVANNISSVTFTGNSATPDYVTITMTAQKTMTSGRSIQTPLYATAELRNS